MSTKKLPAYELPFEAMGLSKLKANFSAIPITESDCASPYVVKVTLDGAVLGRTTFGSSLEDSAQAWALDNQGWVSPKILEAFSLSTKNIQADSRVVENKYLVSKDASRPVQMAEFVQMVRRLAEKPAVTRYVVRPLSVEEEGIGGPARTGCTIEQLPVVGWEEKDCQPIFFFGHKLIYGQGTDNSFLVADFDCIASTLALAIEWGSRPSLGLSLQTVPTSTPEIAESIRLANQSKPSKDASS